MKLYKIYIFTLSLVKEVKDSDPSSFLSDVPVHIVGSLSCLPQNQKKNSPAITKEGGFGFEDQSMGSESLLTRLIHTSISIFSKICIIYNFHHLGLREPPVSCSDF